MSNRPTVKDVAREAGVSVTTVDRALNGRMRVREETMRKIANAAHKVGYHARGLIDHRLMTVVPEMTFGIILLKQRQEFYQNFEREILAAVASRTDIRGKVIIRFAETQAPEEFAGLLEELGHKVDAIGCTGLNHQKLNHVVERLNEKGVPVFSLLNDFAQGIRRNYLGLNNMKIGRIAAWMVTTGAILPGKLAVFIGGNRWHGHDLRDAGFRSFVRDSAPEFQVLDAFVNLEVRQVTYEATLDLMARYPDLRGMYFAGGGMEGAIAAMREVVEPGKVALVVNELTAESRAGLHDGFVTMVIETPLQRLCRDLVQLMISEIQEPVTGIVEQHFLDPRIILPEMV